MVVKRKTIRKSRIKTKGRKTRGSFLGLGSGQSTAVTVIDNRPHKTRYSSSSPPRKEQTYGFEFKTRDDIGTGTVGSKAYKAQLKKAQKEEARRRKADLAEQKRRDRLDVLARETQLNIAEAKKSESLRRKRESGRSARRSSTGGRIAGGVLKGVFGAVSPKRKTIKRRRSY